MDKAVPDWPFADPPGDLGPHTPVVAAERLLAIDPLIVGVDEPLEEVIRRAGAGAATRVVAVVDGAGVLAGVLDSRDLVASIVGRLAPGALLSEIHDADGIEAFNRYVEARTAGDLMRPPTALRPTTTLGEAFRLMHEAGLSGAYVVDAAGRPTGYVDGLELAAAVVGPG